MAAEPPEGWCPHHDGDGRRCTRVAGHTDDCWFPRGRGRGRPKIGPRVELTIPAETLDRLDARAEVDGVDRAEMIRRLLRIALG